MAEVVFVLGAGASAHAGVPTMATFIETARDLRRTGNLDSDQREAFDLVFKAISELQGIHSKAQFDIHNVESVFAAFEIGKIVRGFVGYGEDDYDRLITSTRQMLAVVVQRTLNVPVQRNPESGTKVLAPYPYADFELLLRHLRTNARPKRSVAVITFNYDLGVDLAFSTIRPWRIDYALSKKVSTSAIPLLKLHGSVGWARCSKSDCDEVIPVDLEGYVRRLDAEGLSNGGSVHLDLGDELGRMSHCGLPVRPDPFLVPPTWNKTEHHMRVSRVWARAAAELKGAENIFIVGYSQPPSDEFFRYLYGIGAMGQTTLRRFWVFNPDEEIAGRFRDLLGPGALQRFLFRDIPFNEAIIGIRQEF